MKQALLMAGALAISAGTPAWAQSLMPLHAKTADGSSAVTIELAQATYPPAPDGVIAAPVPPPEAPPPSAEMPPPPPPVVPGATAYVWSSGHWGWTGSRYVWIPGRYHQKPEVTAHWVPGRWARRGDGEWAWVNGHWRYSTHGYGE